MNSPLSPNQIRGEGWLARWSAALGFLLLAATVFFSWRYSACKYPWFSSSRGLSPVHWVNTMKFPDNFVRDYEGGVQIYKNCLMMWIYPAVDFLLGVPSEITVVWVILFEYLVLAAGVYAFFRVILPKAPFAAFVLVVVLIDTTLIRDINFARFKHPFFWGLYYNLSDALRLFALAAFLKRRLLLSAVCTGVAFMVHPTQAVVLVAFLVAASIPLIRELQWKRVLLGVGIFGMLCVSWLLFTLEPHSVTNKGIPNEVWMDLSFRFNSHWFISRHHLFSTRSLRRFFPFITLLLLGGYYLWREKKSDRDARSLLYGIICLLILTGIGVYISQNQISPFLIKLALHRSNDLIVLVLLPFFITGLFKDWSEKNFLLSATAAGMLVLPYVSSSPGYAFGLAGVLLIPAYITLIKEGPRKAPWLLVLVCLHLMSVALLVYFNARGWIKAFDVPQLTGGPALRVYLFGFLLFSILVAIARRRIDSPAVNCLKGMCLLGFFLVYLHWENFQSFGKIRNCSGGEFMKTQLWARDNTPTDALFMYDPTKHYGWREYSARSSFGNIREWLHVGWLYDSNPKIFREGVRRAGAFGFRLEDHFGEQRKGPFSVKGFYAQVLQIMYDSPARDLKHMAGEYEIDYMVFVKPRMKRKLKKLPVAYENKDYIVFDMRKWSGHPSFDGRENQELLAAD